MIARQLSEKFLGGGGFKDYSKTPDYGNLNQKLNFVPYDSK